MQQLPQVAAALRPGGVLSEELPAAGEDPEELPIQVVAVSEDDDSGVLHVSALLFRKSLAFQCCCPKCLCHCHVHGVELVVARHLLGELPAALVLEHDEVAEELLARKRP